MEERSKYKHYHISYMHTYAYHVPSSGTLEEIREGAKEENDRE
jgi:hypothetical protein